MTNYSPLRYPGGKGKLAPYISTLLNVNGLEGGHYAEPFAGGAAVALELLFSERVKQIHINDLDWAIYAFWYCAVNHTEEFVALIYETEISVDTWLQAREIKKAGQEKSIIEAAFSTFFLNRTNRSGILNGGIIGGHSQDGDWKIDCRFNKEELISRIRRIGFHGSRITVTNLDASVFLADYVPEIAPRTLVYIDPPYYVKGAYLYRNHFTHADHVRLAHVISKMRKHPWLVSYDNVEQIRSIYSDYEQEQFSIGYSARNYGKGSEVMIFGPDLHRPSKIYTNKAEQKRLLSIT